MTQTLLSAAEVDSMRTLLVESLPDSCDVVTPGAQSQNTSGGTIRAADDTVSVACRVSPLTATSEGIVASGQMEAASQWVVTLPAGTVVGESDRIGYQGRRLDIIHVNVPRSWTLAVRVVCSEARR